MQRSTERILTTHAGSLPRGEPLGPMLLDEEQGKEVDRNALREAADARVSHVLR
jgi:5-methyltetrahydropteroyltriglutamate--homocysteine methyltransferase